MAPSDETGDSADAQRVADETPGRSPDDWAKTGRAMLAFVCFWCLLLAFGSVVPNAGDVHRREAAQALLDTGVPATATEVDRYINMGRDWYVATVRVTYPTPDGPVVADLLATDPDDPVVREGGMLTRGPHEYWEAAPAESRYAAPLEVLHDRVDPSVVMATADAHAAMVVGHPQPWKALAYATPTLLVLTVPRWRRWLTAPLRRRWVMHAK